MNYSSMTPTSVVKNQIRIDEPSVIVAIPEIGSTNILADIHSSSLLLSNCDGIIVPNKMFTIGMKKFNGKAHYLDVKKLSLKTDEGSKKLRIIGSFITPKQDKTQLVTSEPNNYMFYDGSIISEAFSSLQQNFPEKILAHILFDQIKNIYIESKKIDVKKNIEVIFFLKDANSQYYQLFKSIKSLIPEKELETLNFFDKYVSVCINNYLIPIMSNQGGKTKFNYTFVNKIEDILLKTQAITQKENENPIDTKTENLPHLEKPASSFITNIVSDLAEKKVTASIDENDDIKIELNPNDVLKVLKKYKINNPDIAANVKTAIDAYIARKGSKLSTDETEKIILKSINYTIHGTEDVPEEYIAKPALLFNKLNDIKTYQVPLSFPKMKDNIIDPSGFIDIKYTCGQNRQKFEFTDSIHNNVRKLFSSIENINYHPIKIKSIKHEIKDNDLDRFILYKITLQNTTGENKEPYETELKVPSPVNERYFKLRGNHYIMSTQQFFRPITKTDKTEVRILTNYAMVRVGIKNLKFNPSDINDVIEYIKIKYPILIKQLNKNSVIFNDDSAIFFDGNLIYSDNGGLQIFEDQDTGKLKDSNGNDIKYGKYEYLYQIACSKILSIDSNDKLTKTKLSIPYFQAHIGGIKLPLILYLWSQKGLLSTLNDFNINYKLEKTPVGAVSVPTTNDNFLNIFPENVRERLFVNGILAARIKTIIPDLTDKQAIYDYIAQTYGGRSVVLLNLMTENLIDPISKQLLEFENLPTNLPALLTGRALDLLLNEKPSNLADLSVYRTRLSEMIIQTMYKQIKQAHNHYRSKVEYGDNTAKLVFDPDYIIKNLLGDIGVLKNTEPVNPVDELMLASQVIKTGKGGMLKVCLD